MSSILPLLPYLQVLLAGLLIVAILLQQRGASLGGAFGGDNFSAAFYTRRGPELLLFRVSIALAIALVGSVAAQFFFSGI